MKKIIIGAVFIGAAVFAVVALASPSEFVADTFTSGDWAKISGGLAILCFSAGAWLAKTQRADIEMLRAKIDALIERNYAREQKNIETIQSFTLALNSHSANIARLAAAVEQRAGKRSAGD